MNSEGYSEDSSLGAIVSDVEFPIPPSLQKHRKDAWISRAQEQEALGYVDRLTDRVVENYKKAVMRQPSYYWKGGGRGGLIENAKTGQHEVKAYKIAQQARMKALAAKRETTASLKPGSDVERLQPSITDPGERSDMKEMFTYPIRSRFDFRTNTYTVSDPVRGKVKGLTERQALERVFNTDKIEGNDNIGYTLHGEPIAMDRPQRTDKYRTWGQTPFVSPMKLRLGHMRKAYAIQNKLGEHSGFTYPALTQGQQTIMKQLGIQDSPEGMSVEDSTIVTAPSAISFIRREASKSSKQGGTKEERKAMREKGAVVDKMLSTGGYKPFFIRKATNKGQSTLNKELYNTAKDRAAALEEVGKKPWKSAIPFSREQKYMKERGREQTDLMYEMDDPTAAGVDIAGAYQNTGGKSQLQGAFQEASRMNNPSGETKSSLQQFTYNPAYAQEADKQALETDISVSDSPLTDQEARNPYRELVEESEN